MKAELLFYFHKIPVSYRRNPIWSSKRWEGMLYGWHRRLRNHQDRTPLSCHSLQRKLSKHNLNATLVKFSRILSTSWMRMACLTVWAKSTKSELVAASSLAWLGSTATLCLDHNNWWEQRQQEQNRSLKQHYEWAYEARGKDHRQRPPWSAKM